MRKPKSRKVGRDASSGRFITVKEARRRRSTAVVETVTAPTRRRRKG